ncbi:MAG TPA: hypothetical protein VJ036_05870 [bacterium]|nr:hypothetical protein [bacterium]
MATEEKPICFDCSYFYPASAELTEYGICLLDSALDNCLDDLLENLNYHSYQELIEARKFPGDRDACTDYEEADSFEISDYDPEEELELQGEDGEGYHSDYKHISLDFKLEQFEQGDRDQRNKLLRWLGHWVLLGSDQAFEALYACLKMLPLPENIEDVHTKIRILEHLADRNIPDRRAKLIPLLIGELYLVPSNNTTRLWITKIVQYLTKCPEEEVRDPLQTLLRTRKFAPRMRRKIEAVLQPPVEEDFYYW